MEFELKKKKKKEVEFEAFSEDCVWQSSVSPSLSFGRTGKNSHRIQRRTEYGIVLQRARYFRHQEMDSLPLWSIQHAIMTLNNPSGAEIMTAENVKGKVNCSPKFMKVKSA